VLTLRERALGAANEALAVGRGRVLGASQGEVAASRLAIPRRAQRALRAAMGTPRMLPSEACGSPEIVEGSLCRFSGEGGGLVVDR
jgi:hypothetical protein